MVIPFSVSAHYNCDMMIFVIFSVLFLILMTQSALYWRQRQHFLAQNVSSVTQRYSIMRIRRQLFSEFCLLTPLLIVLLSGSYSTFSTSIIVCAIVLIQLFLKTSLNYWWVFSVEKSFEFNNSTKSLFWIDQLKSWLMVLVGISVLFIVTIVDSPWGWLLLWVIFIFSLTQFQALHSKLYDHFDTLQQGTLRQRITKLAEQCDYDFQNIHVVDKSKRSNHSNAYFTGFGHNKRIVLDDNLLQHLSEDEILAVCAHELGHYKLHHQLKLFGLIGLLSSLWLFGVVNYFDPQWLHLPVNSSPLVVLLLTSPIALFVAQPLLMYLSRRFEQEADDFALYFEPAQNLAQALDRLSSTNRMIKSADRWYMVFYYSHPPILSRLTNLLSKQKS